VGEAEGVVKGMRRKRKIRRIHRTPSNKMERYRKEYPQFIYGDDGPMKSVLAPYLPPQNLPPKLNEILIGFVETVRLNDTRIFHPIAIEYFKIMKRGGDPERAIRRIAEKYDRCLLCDEFPYLLNVKDGGKVNSIVEDFDTRMRLNYLYFSIVIGELIFKTIRTRGLFDSLFPQYDIQVIPDGGDYYIRPRALEKMNTPYGDLYYSPGSKTVIFKDVKYRLAFSRHSLERLSERLVIDPKGYGGYSDFWENIFDEAQGFICQYLREDLRGEVWFGVYVPEYQSPLFGELFHELFQASKNIGYVKVGYFVCAKPDERNRMMPIKTFLTQGMGGTPEEKFVRKLQARPTRSVLSEAANKISSIQTYSGILQNQSQYIKLLKHFHHAGVSQIYVAGEDELTVTLPSNSC
jgi:hypothetical protein